MKVSKGQCLYRTFCVFRAFNAYVPQTTPESDWKLPTGFHIRNSVASDCGGETRNSNLDSRTCETMRFSCWHQRWREQSRGRHSVQNFQQQCEEFWHVGRRAGIDAALEGENDSTDTENERERKVGREVGRNASKHRRDCRRRCTRGSNENLVYRWLTRYNEGGNEATRRSVVDPSPRCLTGRLVWTRFRSEWALRTGIRDGGRYNPALAWNPDWAASFFLPSSLLAGVMPWLIC